MKTRRLPGLLLLLLSVWLAPVCAKNADEFTATTLSGTTLSFDPNNLDTPTLIVVWASWCRFCLAEMPELITLAKELKENLAVIGINVDKNSQNGRDIVIKHELPYPSISDPDLVVADKYGVRGTPDLILVNQTGTIVDRSNRLHKIIDTVRKHSQR